jgi:hypothetical protein
MIHSSLLSAMPSLLLLLLTQLPPTDKYCGDAVCTPAINILEDMGVLKELMDNNEAHFADAGAKGAAVQWLQASPTSRGLVLFACSVAGWHMLSGAA